MRRPCPEPPLDPPDDSEPWTGRGEDDPEPDEEPIDPNREVDWESRR